MSLKENVELIKEELSSEEKFFEKAVVTEKFLKKYKKSLIAGVSVVVIFALANVAYNVKEKNRIASANEQLAILLKNPSDKMAQEQLKGLSPKLFEVWSLSKAIVEKNTQKLQQLKESQLPIVADIATYESAQNEQNTKELENYTMRQDALYKDLAIVEEAIIDIENNKIKEAKEKLAMIEQGSALEGIVKVLNHYGVQ